MQVQVRVIVNSCGHAPGVTRSVNVTTGLGSQLSVQLAEPVLAGSVGTSHSIVTSAGHVITGGVLSTTEMF